jgi:parallel beta-helix repeat protein
VKTKTLLVSLILALGLTLGVVWLLDVSATPSVAAPASSAAELSNGGLTRYVAITGTDSGTCSTPVSACLTIQYAVDQAGAGDEILVAAGVYTGVQARSGVTQAVYISKSVTVRGGYTTMDGFASPPDPGANPTTLDAQGQGRVIHVTGNVSPTIEGLRIAGGNAAGLGGGLANQDAGGGVYAYGAHPTIRDCRVFSNTASGQGGGVYAGGQSDKVVLASNEVYSNTASDGGGFYIHNSDNVLLEANQVYSNTATYGGGMHFYFSDNATLTGNSVHHNTVANAGGGIMLHACANAMLINNLVWENQTHGALNVAAGIQVWPDTSARLLHNTIARNRGDPVQGQGYGVGVYGESTVWLTNTILVSNPVGIHAGSAVTLEATLWGSGAWANDTDWIGPITSTDDYTGNPAFVNPDGGDYHIGFESAAINRGADAGVETDIDGDSRVLVAPPDLGADEVTCFVRLNDDPYPTVQAAVDASTHPTDVVKVAGICRDVQVRPDPDYFWTPAVGDE